MERFQQIEEIFQEALQRTPAQRDAYVREACRGDSDLQQEVSSLLANHSDPTGADPWAAQAAVQLISAHGSLQPGQCLGPYRIESFLAAGGMGAVYRATDTRLHRQVAIKVSAGSFNERFERESRVIASLNHPHICQLHDVGPNYLVMEFVEGEPLKGPLSVEKAVEYGVQILDALNTAHRKGITHRDLKPANILVTKQGIKLLDFGLARQSGPLQRSDATLTAGLTGQGQFIGTLQYMSPEQLQGNEADARSDLFSFGCVLYEILSGKRAFDGPSPASVIAAILEREPAPLDLPPPLDRVVRTCLAKDPEHRFQNTLDLRRNLAWAVEPLPISTKPRRRPWRIGAAATALILGAVAEFWAVSNVRRPGKEARALRLQIDPPPGGRFILGGARAGDPAISPDGKMAVYGAAVNGTIGLWIRPLDGTSARLLPGTDDGRQPFWSPDSRSIAFVIGSRLRKMNADGSMPVDIGTVRTLRGASWGSDGYILFSQVEPRSAPFSVYSIYRISESGGTPSLLTAPDLSRGEVGYRWPQVLPEARFMYSVEAVRPEDSGAYAAPVNRPGERTKLVTTESKVVYAPSVGGKGYLLWMRGGAIVAQEFDPVKLRVSGEPQEVAPALSGTPQGELHVTASASGLLMYGAFGELTQLAWWSREGRPLREVGDPMDGIIMFRPAPDERHIAVQRPTGEVHDLWLLDAERGVTTRFTADRTLSTQPVWSPDGRMILFTHLGSSAILRKPANGIGDEEVLIQRPTASLPYDWSRDGRWVLAREMSPDTKYDIWKLPLTADGKMQEGAAPTPYLNTRFNELQARFSPEPSPRWVAYVSDESGRPEVYVDAFPEPRGKKRISTSGGQYPKWGADGRELFYVSPENKLMAVSLKHGSDTLEPSAPRELFPLPMRSTAAGATYEPSGDGQRFLVLTSPEATLQLLHVIVNWPALLKKGAASQ
jgi:Tol biopolymer transport system component/predicted Ser/Thr protein kinase